MLSTTFCLQITDYYYFVLQIEIDTAHFKGNFPASCVIEGKIDVRSPSLSA